MTLYRQLQPQDAKRNIYLINAKGSTQKLLNLLIKSTGLEEDSWMLWIFFFFNKEKKYEAFFTLNAGLTDFPDLGFKNTFYSLQFRGTERADRDPSLPYYHTNTLIILNYHK